MRGALLALETTGLVSRAALFVDGRPEGESRATGERSHGRDLLPLVRDLLREAGVLRPKVVAVSAGPGSYTGIRVGMAAAMGLAVGWEARLVAVPTFEAWALSAWQETQGGVLALRPAGRDEAFVQMFKAPDEPPGEARRIGREAFSNLVAGAMGLLLVGEIPPAWNPLVKDMGGPTFLPAGGARSIGGWALHHEEDAHGLEFLPIYLRPPGTGGRGGTA